MTSIPGYDAWKLMTPEEAGVYGEEQGEDHGDDDPNCDALTDDPDAHAAYLAKWQRYVDEGQFCPTCGYDAEHIEHGKCTGPQGQTVSQFRCTHCGDEWFGPINQEEA